MGKIRPLSRDLIGKIAAGEVVERPAAAVRELVESSLDAGASSVTVEIREGGLDYIRVTDNGCGIDASDIRLAFERHATSKLRTESELGAIATLGFRGEALASIAAVARVTLVTRTAEMDAGLKVANEGGSILSITEAACPVGTSLIVEDLFFNTPVRRNFMKKPSAEAAAVGEYMMHLILSRPEVRFRFMSGGKVIYQSAGDGRLSSAVHAVFGGAALRAMRPVEGNESGVLLKGFVGIGDLARGNRNNECFFINGRMMYSALLSAALEEGCRERVMIGKYPVAVLHLTVPFEAVDVNVHPNKLEVRFRDEAAVSEAVRSLVLLALRDRDAFERPVPLMPEKAKDDSPEAPPAPSESLPPVKSAAVVSSSRTLPESARTIPASAIAGPAFVTQVTAAKRSEKPAQTVPVAPSCMPSPGGQQPRESEHPVPAEYPGTGTRQPESARFAEGEARLTGPGPEQIGEETDSVRERDSAAVTELASGGTRGQAPHSGREPSFKEESFVKAPLPIRILGAAFHTYIIVEYQDQLLLIDQHAVHERLLFDRLMKEYVSGEKIASQEMLVPLVMSVTAAEEKLLEENRELLEKTGLSVEPFGAHEVAIRSVPMVLGEPESIPFVREILSELESGKNPGFEKKRAAILQTACKHAVKGGESLPEEVLRDLVTRMVDEKVTPTCPHGRPLVVGISHRELDRRFKRIQS